MFHMLFLIETVKLLIPLKKRHALKKGKIEEDKLKIKQKICI